MSAPSTSTASLLLGSGRLPRFQSLRGPTKSPSSTRLRSCAGARPHLLAPISASALPLRVTAAPSPVVEAEDDAGRAAAVRRVAVAVACGALAVAWSHRALAVGAAAAGAGTGEGAGASGAVEAATGIGGMALRGSWPRVLQILQLLREQGLIHAALLGLSAFFSMVETSITTLWPWKTSLANDTSCESNVTTPQNPLRDASNPSGVFHQRYWFDFGGSIDLNGLITILMRIWLQH